MHLQLCKCLNSAAINCAKRCGGKPKTKVGSITSSLGIHDFFDLTRAKPGMFGLEMPQANQNFQPSPYPDAYPEPYLCWPDRHSMPREGSSLRKHSVRRELLNCGRLSRHLHWSGILRWLWQYPMSQGQGVPGEPDGLVWSQKWRLRLRRALCLQGTFPLGCCLESVFTESQMLWRSSTRLLDLCVEVVGECMGSHPPGLIRYYLFLFTQGRSGFRENTSVLRQCNHDLYFIYFTILLVS